MRSHIAFTTTFDDPGSVEELSIDDCDLVYAGREEIEIDDTGEAYDNCPMADAGHLTVPSCGGLRCIYCKAMVAR